jgi:hypothetical protein
MNAMLRMKPLLAATVLCSAFAVSGCSTEQGAATGALAGAAVGGIATNSVGGAIVGAGVGALAGAVLVQNTHGMCTYRYHHRYYREPCRY